MHTQGTVPGNPGTRVPGYLEENFVLIFPSKSHPPQGIGRRFWSPIITGYPWYTCTQALGVGAEVTSEAVCCSSVSVPGYPGTR
eukprot:1974742-Rhodomonas_salina.1